MDIYSMFSKYNPDKSPVCAFLAGKTLSDLDFLDRVKPTRLFWSALGAGVAGLPLVALEKEGTRPWAGGIPENAFIKWCTDRNIKVFGVVWEVQGYDQILCSIDRKTGHLSSLFRINPRAKRGRWGLDAFYQNRYPQVGHWEDYFQWRIKHADGSQGKSFVDEGACRTLYGWKPWALWMLPHVLGDYSTYAMCRNSPFWLAYLKRLVELQIDAGVQGIQLDESAIPIDTVWSGAGYCKYCMRGVKKYIGTHYAKEQLAHHGIMDETDLRKYFVRKGGDYFRAHLLVKGFPFWREYRKAQYAMTQTSFADLVQHIRAYGQRKGKSIEITGNFVQAAPFYLPLVPSVDFVALECNFANPAIDHNHFYYRLFQGFGKVVTMVPVITSSRALRHNQKRNVLKSYIYEAAAVGGHFMIPYSCYTLIDKPYYPPVEPIEEGFSFLREQENLLKGKQKGLVTIAFSFPTHQWEYTYLHQALMGSSPYLRRVHSLARFLSCAGIPYSILILGDGELLPDFVTDPATIREPIILMDAISMTDRQIDTFTELAKVGRAFIVGDCGSKDEFWRKRATVKLKPARVPWARVRTMLKGLPKPFKISFGNQAVGAFMDNTKRIVRVANLAFNFRQDAFIPRKTSLRAPGRQITVVTPQGSQPPAREKVSFTIKDFAAAVIE